MKLKTVWEKVPLKNYIYLALGVNLLTLIIILATQSFMPPEVPLFYGNAVGEAQLVKTILLTVAPIASIVILILNIFLSSVVHDSFLKKVLVITTFLVSLLTSITIIKIILLVNFF